MAVFKSFRGLLYVKRRPKIYKVDGIPGQFGGNDGIVLAKYPSAYPKTDQQKAIGDAARACGIKSGMKKPELVRAMRECIPGKFH